MVNGFRTINKVLNEEFGSKFRVRSRVQHETPEEVRRTHRLKRYGHNNKDEDNSLDTLYDKSKFKVIQGWLWN